MSVHTSESARPPLVILGASGFGREVWGILHRLGTYDVLGFIDDGTPDRAPLERLNARLLGTTAILSEIPDGTYYVAAVGSGRIRRILAERAEAHGLRPATIVDPSATVGLDVELGAGTVVCQGVHITTAVRVGAHGQINLNSTVGHDAVLDDYVTIFPLVAIAGSAHLENETTFGATSCVNPSVRVGEGAYIGAGAAVTKDVAPYTLVAGVPAVPKKELPRA